MNLWVRHNSSLKRVMSAQLDKVMMIYYSNDIADLNLIAGRLINTS